MQQVRTESFPLHHAVLVEDALRGARCSMVSPQGARAASVLLICVEMKWLALSYVAADWQHQRCCMPNVLRVLLASYLLRALQFKFNSDSIRIQIRDIRIYPDIPRKTNQPPFFRPALFVCLF